jgi:O-antigen/teichoic acid export membrane protein
VQKTNTTESTARQLRYFVELRGVVVFRILAASASFAAIPIMLRYLGVEVFGIWATLLSILGWIIFFDLGIGNGVRNKIAEAMAIGDRAAVARLISVGYSSLTVIAILIFGIFSILIACSNWRSIFNTEAYSENGLRTTVLISALFVCINFVVGFVSQILAACQRVSMTFLMQLLANMFVLIAVLGLLYSNDVSLELLSLIYGSCILLANGCVSYLFFRENIDLLPKWSLDKELFVSIFKVGGRFLLIQMAALILFTTDRLVITQLFGPQEVSAYEIVFKLFSIITLLHSTITAPLWSAYTEAHVRGDLGWIRNMMRLQVKYFLWIAVISVLLTFAMPLIIRLWVGDRVNASFIFIALMALLTVLSCWANVFAMYINGVGALNLQLYTSLIAVLVNIPLSVFLAQNTDLGVAAVALATVISITPAVIGLPLQTYQLINNKKPI